MVKIVGTFPICRFMRYLCNTCHYRKCISQQKLNLKPSFIVFQTGFFNRCVLYVEQISILKYLLFQFEIQYLAYCDIVSQNNYSKAVRVLYHINKEGKIFLLRRILNYAQNEAIETW